MNADLTFPEQELVRKYCSGRKINRPETNVWTAVKLLFLLEILTLLLSGAAFYVSGLLGYTTAFLYWYSITGFIVLILNLKKISVLSIRLYQHYAPESTRRKCTLQPSCSEYSLLALNKYNIVKAYRKIYIRLFQTCKGVYQVDYP